MTPKKGIKWFIFTFIAVVGGICFFSLQGILTRLSTSFGYVHQPTKIRTLMKYGHLKQRELEESKIWPHMKHIPNIINVYKKKVAAAASCRDVLIDPKSWWRSNFTTDANTAEQDFERIDKAARCGAFHISEYMSTPPQRYLYEFEKEYLKDPPLQDALAATNEKFSSVELLKKSSRFFLEDHAVFIIRTKDGRNQSRTKGGDIIRAWIETVEGQYTHRVAAQVVDLHNGTYLAKAFLPWNGTLRLYTALAYPREYMRAISFIQQTAKTFVQMIGKFQKQKISEATPCFYMPLLPGFSPDEMCNLTAMTGTPWYCGRPRKTSLSCQDFACTRTATTNVEAFIPATEAEMIILERTTRSPFIRFIMPHIDIQVLPKEGVQRVPSPHLPCSRIKTQDSWTQEEPTGYFYRGVWHSFLCSGRNLTMSNCLRNKNIVVLGDSNGRVHYDGLVRILQCKSLIKRTSKKWHAPLKCVKPEDNTEITWLPHSSPFLSYSDRWTQLEDLTSSAYFIDKIPWDGRTPWVIINHYVHLTPFHFSVFETKYRSLKDAIVRLLARQPKSRIVIRGPHMYWQGWPKHYNLGDQFGTFLMRIQREIFESVSDRVFFLHVWDASIAMRNSGTHPTFGSDLTKQALGYLCDE